MTKEKTQEKKIIINPNLTRESYILGEIIGDLLEHLLQ
jgi:glycine betaine/choline ABC-type transport system substrate-binding protein